MSQNFVGGSCVPLQHAKHQSQVPVISVVSQYEHSVILHLVYTMFIPYSSLESQSEWAWIIPILYWTCRTLRLCSLRPSILLSWKSPRTSLLLGRPPSSFFHLPLETHGRTAAKSPSRPQQGRHPSSAGILQPEHLRKTGPACCARFWSDGKGDVPKYDYFELSGISQT